MGDSANQRAGVVRRRPSWSVDADEIIVRPPQTRGWRRRYEAAIASMVATSLFGLLLMLKSPGFLVGWFLLIFPAFLVWKGLQVLRPSYFRFALTAEGLLHPTLGLIPWHDVAGAGAAGDSQRAAVAVVISDGATYRARLPAWKRWLYPLGRGGRLRLTFPAGTISHDPWQLADEINGHVTATR